MAVADEGDGDIDALEEAGGVDAAEDEAAFVQGLRALSGGADAHSRERLADRCEEAGLLRQCAAVADYRECVHLQAVVVVESERLVLNHTAVELEFAVFLHLLEAVP